MNLGKTDAPKTLESYIEKIDALVMSVGVSGSLDFVNQRWLDTLGYDESDVSDLKVKTFVFPGFAKKLIDTISEVIRGRAVAHFEVDLVTKKGDTVRTSGSITPRFEKGKIVAGLCILRDTTAQKGEEVVLRRAKIHADFFVDIMIHDLTNINQEILSVFEILQMDSELPSHLAELVEPSIKEIERASHLVTNVRILSLLESGKKHLENIDPAEALATAVASIDDFSEIKRLSVTASFKPGEYTVIADGYLVEVFKALLHNVLKFDVAKRVQVEVSVQEVRHTPYLRVSVADHGCGIPDERKETIFDRISSEEGIKGVGLGLVLVRQIVESYGGFIRVEDRVPKSHTSGANIVILLRRAT